MFSRETETNVDSSLSFSILFVSVGFFFRLFACVYDYTIKMFNLAIVGRTCVDSCRVVACARRFPNRWVESIRLDWDSS